MDKWITNTIIFQCCHLIIFLTSEKIQNWEGLCLDMPEVSSGLLQFFWMQDRTMMPMQSVTDGIKVHHQVMRQQLLALNYPIYCFGVLIIFETSFAFCRIWWVIVDLPLDKGLLLCFSVILPLPWGDEVYRRLRICRTRP